MLLSMHGFKKYNFDGSAGIQANKGSWHKCWSLFSNWKFCRYSKWHYVTNYCPIASNIMKEISNLWIKGCRQRFSLYSAVSIEEFGRNSPVDIWNIFFSFSWSLNLLYRKSLIAINEQNVRAANGQSNIKNSISGWIYYDKYITNRGMFKTVID